MVMRSGMQQAEYFVYPDDPSSHHFALNFEYYTHFTSPIRRYPDVMVHRVLAALLVGEDDGFQKEGEASKQVEVCNEKKSSSRKAQEQLDRSVFCVYLRSRKEWFYSNGTVLRMDEGKGTSPDDTVTIYVHQLGREKRVRLKSDGTADQLYTKEVQDELMLVKSWLFRGRGECTLSWDAPDKSGSKKQTLRVLSCVPIVVIPTDTVPIDFAIFFVSPFHRKFAEVAADAEEQEGLDWVNDEDVPEGMDVVFASGD